MRGRQCSIFVATLAIWLQGTACTREREVHSADASQVVEDEIRFVNVLLANYQGLGDRADSTRLERLLQRHSDVFSVELAAALTAEIVAGQIEPGVGALDFDPIFASQDPCDAYVADSTFVRQEEIWVRVIAKCAGRSVVQPEHYFIVARIQSALRVTDIVYPNRTPTRLREMLPVRPK